MEGYRARRPFNAMKTLLIFIAIPLLAVDAPKPIPAEYQTLFGGLVAQLQAAQRAVDAAEARLRADVCKAAKLKVSECEVDWKAGTVAKKQPAKPAEQPKP